MKNVNFWQGNPIVKHLYIHLLVLENCVANLSPTLQIVQPTMFAKLSRTTKRKLHIGKLLKKWKTIYHVYSLLCLWLVNPECTLVPNPIFSAL